MAKTKRRVAPKGEGIEAMTSDDLEQIRFFGNLVGRDGKATFVATEDEQARAVEILRERGEFS